MYISLVLSGIVIVGSMLIQLLAVIFYRWRNTWRYRKRVVATIKQIQVWLDGWYVTAVWTDALTGQSHIFHSRCIEYGLEQRVGDSIHVDVDPHNLDHYRMLL